MTESDPKLDAKIVRKILQTIDAGVVAGLGCGEPGDTCVQAAIRSALGLPHGDEAPGVSRTVRMLPMTLNDARWTSPAARAAGLRRLAIAQLGTATSFHDEAFALLTLQRATDMLANVTQVAAREELSEALADVILSAIASAARPISVEHVGEIMAAIATTHAFDEEGRSTLPRLLQCWDRWKTLRDVVSFFSHFDADYNKEAFIQSVVDLALDVMSDLAAPGTEQYDQAMAAFADRVTEILVELGSPGCKWLHLARKGK